MLGELLTTMSKLEELIERYCPDGVEYKHLAGKTNKDAVARIERGKRITKTDLKVDGQYIVMSGGIDPMGRYNDKNRSAYTVTVSSYGAAGYVAYITEDFWANDVCLSIYPKDETILNNKYMFYALKSQQQYIYDNTTHAIPDHIPTEFLENLEIPVPPLPVQEEIVRILDKFTELEEELEEELELRKKQYEYYRDKMFSLSEDVDSYPITDVFDMRNGYTPSKSNAEYWTDGIVNWFRMEDIRANGHVLDSAIQKVSESAVKGGRLFKANSIMLATSATIGEHALVKVNCLGNQRFTFFSVKDSFEKDVNMDYMNYYFYIIDEWCKTHLHQGNFASVDMDALKKLQIPIPDITEQNKIVELLDRFSTLTEDISEGLPAEIKMRRQQYEYYRDKLLTFKRLEC